MARAAAWWGHLRGVPPGRLAYEIALAAALPALTAWLSARPGSLPLWLVVALAAADAVLVALRRRFPATVLLVAVVLGSAFGQVDQVLLFGLAYSTGFRIRGPWHLTAALAAALVAQTAGNWFKDGVIGSALLLVGAGLFILVIVFPAILARLSAQRRRILSLMHERTVYLTRQQQIVAEQARVREANRIAREMHDSLGHRLTLISLYTGALRSSPGSADETVELLHATSVSAMDELRTIVTVLRDDTVGEEPPRRSTTADVESLIDDARAAGVGIEVTRSGEAVDLPPMIDQAAYRTVQEGVTNALRHARGAFVHAALRYEQDALVVEVVNGPGHRHDAPTSGQGLYGLAERVRLAGGVLYHGTEPDGGFRLAATLPLTSTAPRASEPWTAEPAPPDDFGDDLRRADQRRRLWTVAAGFGLILVLGLCAGGIWLTVRQQTVSRETYDGLRVGEATTTVRKKLPDRSAELHPSRISPAPPGAQCAVYRAAPDTKAARAPAGYRFCFRAGALISKETLDDVG
ncbi:sensor histidine kinase [Actinoplanes sp. NPDC051343]|uniref:sensor histidine kinase n=1 Tax=Actinoplanes sp. NPDC051343 TaxID=3363906 RepID=UPI00378F30A8